MKVEKVKIVVDHRETRKGLVEKLEKVGFVVEIESLEVGDFILSKKVVVELKKVPDFVNSLIDGRLFSQAKELKNNFEKPLYIIEGELVDLFDIRDVHPNAIRSAMMSLLLDYQIPFLFSHSEEETVNLLFTLAKRENLKKGDVFSLRGTKRVWSTEEKQQYLIEGLPLVGPTLAKKLLKEFKNPLNILNAEESDLVRVEKIGPKKAKLIREILEKKGNY